MTAREFIYNLLTATNSHADAQAWVDRFEAETLAAATPAPLSPEPDRLAEIRTLLSSTPSLELQSDAVAWPWWQAARDLADELDRLRSEVADLVRVEASRLPVVAEQAVRIVDLEAERDTLRARIGFWERCTLPDLERKVTDEREAKERWRYRAQKAEARPGPALVLREAASRLDNDDSCTCGGCDSCAVRAAVAELRRMADEAEAGERP